MLDSGRILVVPGAEYLLAVCRWGSCAGRLDSFANCDGGGERGDGLSVTTQTSTQFVRAVVIVTVQQ